MKGNRNATKAGPEPQHWRVAPPPLPVQKRRLTRQTASVPGRRARFNPAARSVSLSEPDRVLLPSSGPVPRQLLQTCFSSPPTWQWLMRGVLLLFEAGWCCCFSALLRDFALLKRNALPRVFAFFSSEPGPSRGGEAAADLVREHEHMTSAAKPAMFELDRGGWPAWPICSGGGEDFNLARKSLPSWKVHFRSKYE